MQIEQVFEDISPRIAVRVLANAVFVGAQALVCRTALSAASRVGNG
ncbi:hypothetical protein FHR87_001695 [Azomonas macrocytogenes]|uniref:Uncharacterized protein n=1 Tax=Azomonas macrocytogenes TaxID=69962 RepID=A0A839T3M7_AZOMA|nr:hypothetical protein [Azomonas macrocytogenes]